MSLSPTQALTIERMRAGGELARVAGGFWCTADTARDYRGVPVWSVNIQTVRALERLGLVERCNRFPEDWKDSRRLV